MQKYAFLLFVLLSTAWGQSPGAEGVATRLTPEEVARFIPWAHNARALLLRAQRDVLALPVANRRAFLEGKIQQVVRESGERRFQTHMRYALNRGLLFVEELSKHSDMSSIGLSENAADLLRRSINVALAFYQSDLDFQQRHAEATHVSAFAAVFVRTMAPGVANVLDEASQYRLVRKLAEMAAWDLAQAANAITFADLIVETQELLGTLPEAPSREGGRRGIQQLNRLGVLALTIPDSPGPILQCMQVLRLRAIADDVALDYCVHQDDPDVISCVATLTRVRELPTEQAYRGCSTSPRPNGHAQCVIMFSHTWDIEDRRMPPEVSQQFCGGELSTPLLQCADALLRVQFAQGRTFHETLRIRRLERIDRAVIARECGRIKGLEGDPGLLELRSFQFTSCVQNEINYTRRRDKGGPEIFDQCAEWLELIADPMRPVEGVGRRRRRGQ